MNDATELESSLTGAIDFFQNLRRKLGSLEADAHAQHDQIHTLSSALAAVEQDRRTDRQTLTSLSGGLVKLQVDERQLEEQLNAVETLVANFQQDQQHIQQTLAAVADDLQAQEAGWRQELADKLAPLDQIVDLEQTVCAHQAQIKQFSTAVEAQGQRLLQFDSTLNHLDQNNHSLNQTLDALKTDFERYEQALSTLTATTGVDEVARRQLQTQQDRLDALMALSTVAEQNLQTARQDIAHLKGEFEIQHRMQADIAQIRQELQKHQDRLKHLETLMGKVSADTNSTRQILNVVQADLATQNDTLHELDQNWRDSLTTYQDRLSSVEIIVAGSGYRPATFLTEAANSSTQAEPAPIAPADLLLSPPIDEARVAALETALAATCSQHQEFEQELGAIQSTLERQDTHFAELQNALTAPLDAVQHRLGELENALDHLSLETRPEMDANAALDCLRQAIAEQSAALEETQQLAWAQIQDLQQRLSEAEAALDSSSQTPEPAISSVDAVTLAGLRDDLSTQVDTLEKLREGWLAQAGTLEGLQETTRQQLTALSATLDAQQQNFQDVVDQVANLQQDIRQIQQTAPTQTIDSERLETAEQSTQELQHDLQALQESVTVLETRLSSQSQAFSGNFDQLRNLQTDIHALQQQVARLDSSPRQLGVIEQELATHEQDINQLKEIIEQIQADSQQMSDSLQQNSDSPIAEVAARLDEQQEQWTQLAATVESIRADSKAAQETVVTMATNVAKRIHEIQNLLVVTENTQSERLQEVEQKLINLQAAFEMLETQRKPRKWFSMPASLTSIMLTAGLGGLAAIIQVIWTID